MQNVSNNGDKMPIIQNESTVQNAPDPVSGMRNTHASSRTYIAAGPPQPSPVYHPNDKGDFGFVRIGEPESQEPGVTTSTGGPWVCANSIMADSPQLKRYGPTTNGNWSTDGENLSYIPVAGTIISTLDELEAELMADDRVRACIGKIPFWLRLTRWQIRVKRLIGR